MKLTSITCPNCCAKLTYPPNALEVKCDYCDSIIKIEQDEQTRLANTRQADLEKVYACIRLLTQKQQLEDEFASVNEQIRQKRMEGFYNPAPPACPHADTAKIYYALLWLGGIPITLFLNYSMLFISHSPNSGLVMVISFVLLVTFFLIAHREKEKGMEERTKVEEFKRQIETERIHWNEAKSQQINALADQLKMLNERIEANSTSIKRQELPEKYLDMKALNYLCNALLRKNAYTLQQAMYQYDVETEHAKRERQMQEQLRRQQESIESLERRTLPAQIQQQNNSQVSGITVSGSPPSCCPRCGDSKAWKYYDDSRQGFSVGKAIVGGVLLGPWGLTAGFLGRSVETYKCEKCGFVRNYK